MKPSYQDDSTIIYTGNCLEVLKTLPDSSVHCCVTSPPYWGLRDYGIQPSVWDGDPACKHEWGEQGKKHRGGPQGANEFSINRDTSARDATGDLKTGSFCLKCGAWLGCHGLEPTIELYVAHAVEIFREVRRVLRDDGTLWLNLGDSYAAGGMGKGSGKQLTNRGTSTGGHMDKPRKAPVGLKPKDLIGIPWRVALALQQDGWYLRCDIIWGKVNPMPESVTDRPTKSHEYIFLMAKSEKYYYDAEAIKEPVTGNSHARGDGVNPKAKRIPTGWDTGPGSHDGIGGRYKNKQNESFSSACNSLVENRNKRSVWTVPTFPFPDAHFATYPPDLIKPCILAGCPVDGIVLDPYMGSGTTALVAKTLNRKSIGIEINPAYVEMIKQRVSQEVLPLWHS